MPKISVIIPAYNAERTILETINSVLKQTFSDLEIIVINDGSTDRTVEVIQNVDDARLKVYSYENSRASGARNHGISHAVGDFISFLDADDLWTPDKLELQLAALNHYPEAGVAYSWTYTIDDKGELLKPFEPLYEGNVYTDLLLANFLTNGSNPLIRKAAIASIGEFDTTLRSGEDWDYWLRLAYKWPFVVVKQHQIFYRRSVTSKSFKLQIIREASLAILDKAMKVLPLELQYLKKHSLSNIYRYNVELYLDSIDNNSTVDIKYVIGNLLSYIRSRPQTLKEIYTYKLIIKILLIIVLSPKLMSRLLQFIKKSKQMKNLQVQP
ncbi:glycosyltransferase family 2 protein [Nostoc parmelioides]|uniref:Glycosyltransferase n=1 Tax=Nostoc parmelioides FACHB-3921 TaxID=2692909 RepID=A0ABR8B837_9NOSO|nr:glycosyltransferase [Nostoc parmelioides]MBD2250023.1 glycosyltransferase [Nostoc parmelioides FACHB-3921]